MENIKRKYFEIWGDLEAQNNTLKVLLLVMAVLLAVSLVLSYLTTRKPPLVVRVSDVGKAEAIQDYRVQNAVTQPELVYFTKLFIEKFTEYNSYTVASDIADAFTLMSANYQKIAKKEVIDSNLISKIGEASIHAKVEMREINVEREDEGVAVLSFLAVRTIFSYQNRDFKDETLFKGDIVLKKISRTMTHPQGLLVEEYREVLVKQLGQ